MRSNVAPVQPEWMTRDFRERHPRAVPGKKPCRVHAKPRCNVCGLHLSHCLCTGLPNVFLPIETVIIQHAFEHHRPTNTGRLAHAILANSRLVRFGAKDCPMDASSFLSPGKSHYVLFPVAGALPATRAQLLPPASAPATVFILDGSWTHASRMRRRIATLRDLPCLALPPGEPSAWRVRRGRAPGELCTLEACARLAELLGLTDQAQRMMDILADVNRLTLSMRSSPGSRDKPG